MVKFVRNVMGLFNSPIEAFEDVKQSGWVTPVLSLAAAVAIIVNSPWTDKTSMQASLKLFLLYKAAQIPALWLAGLTQGGRGSIPQIARVMGFLALFDSVRFIPLRPGVTPPHLIAAAIMLFFAMPILQFLVTKVVHEYQNDGIAFRVTVTSYFLTMVLAGLVYQWLGWSLSWDLLLAGFWISR